MHDMQQITFTIRNEMRKFFGEQTWKCELTGARKMKQKKICNKDKINPSQIKVSI